VGKRAPAVAVGDGGARKGREGGREDCSEVVPRAAHLLGGPPGDVGREEGRGLDARAGLGESLLAHGRVVVELDEPGRIREISDSELPMAHVLAAAKALVANDDVGCNREYDAALAEAEKIPREKTDNQHRQLKRAHRHSMLLDRTNTALSSTGDVWDQVSLSQAVMTQQTIRERYAHVD